MNNRIALTKLIGLFATAWVALAPQARAVCQEGCDPVNINTYLGDDALLNHSGVSNTALGWHALRNNANTSWNTAIGSAALEANTTGYDNTATGVSALEANAIGHSNTATGRDALASNTTGSDNTATGAEALVYNKTGWFNVANGMWALSGNKSGQRNTAMGYFALAANTTGRLNIALGYYAGANTSGDRNIDIGNTGVADESRTIRIGNTVDHASTFIAGISGVTVAGGIGVVIDTNGQLGTVTSSRRYKEAIKPMSKSSEAILDLQPVTFRYKKELDPKAIPQFGLVAEEVAKVDPDLVARDESGKPYSVRYEAVNAMLLNEFLKEHRKVEKLEEIVNRLEATVARQAAQIEKVSARVQAGQAAPRLVSTGD